LNERLTLAGWIAESFATGDGGTIGNDTVREMVEAIAPWTPAEETTLMPPLTVALLAAWKQICDNTEDRPQQAGAAEVAAVLGTSAANWLQQVLRGRVRLACLLGAAAARELFPYWPPTPFAQAAAREEGKP
ncbi:MAG TPA: hypothetical protein VEL76_22865, partial [Gemmataceae bacterium]|nr:hypothetical protein [Gemmataceae bacterium]